LNGKKIKEISNPVEAELRRFIDIYQ